MDKKRNIELENWLIETTGEEMMANHLGPNWNRFNEECGFYPNISMTIANQVWGHQQKRIDELQARVDAALERASHACIGSAMFHKRFNEVISILNDVEALKGGEV